MCAGCESKGGRVEYPKARGRLRPGLSEKAFWTLEEVMVG